MAEFVAVWSLLAAVVASPWVSAAALSDNGQFSPATTAVLWIVSLGVLLVGLVAFFVFLRRKMIGGRSAAHACRVFSVHAAATFLILIVAFLAADVVLARLKPLPASAHLDVPKARIYGWAFAPHQSITIVNPDTGEIYRERANGQGWRDVDHPAQKPGPRLLLIGDSVLFGVGVPLEQTIGRHLQRALGDRCEVIAVGLPAWGTDQQYLFLENEGWAYRPDLVILMFTLANDVIDNMRNHWAFTKARKPRFHLVDDRLELELLPPWRPSILRRLFARSTICRYLRFWRQMRRFDPNVPEFSYAQRVGERSSNAANSRPPEGTEPDYSPQAIIAKDWNDDLVQGWRLTLRLIEEIARGCRSRDAAFVLYAGGQMLPEREPKVFGETTTDRGKTHRLDPEKPFRLLREFCRRNEIPYIDEPLDFRRDYWEGRLTFRNDMHPTADGNRRIAENIADWLARRGMLPDDAGGEITYPSK